MTSKQKLLVDEFDVWSSANSEIRLGRGKQPGDFIACYGVRKIKELMLNLAFCGKLVEQDDAEDSAEDPVVEERWRVVVTAADLDESTWVTEREGQRVLQEHQLPTETDNGGL